MPYFQQYGRMLSLCHQPKHRQVRFIEDSSTSTSILFIFSFTARPSHNVITFAPILLAGCLKKPIDCWFIWHSVIIIVFPSEKHITSEGKSDKLKILILRFNFSYFYVKILWYDSTYTNCTAFIFNIKFSDYKSIIISRIRIKQNCLEKLKRTLQKPCFLCKDRWLLGQGIILV